MEMSTTEKYVFLSYWRLTEIITTFSLVCFFCTTSIWIQQYLHVSLYPLGGFPQPDACTWSIYWSKPFVWRENPACQHCLLSHQTQHFSWASIFLATLKVDRFLSAIVGKSSLFTSDCQSGAPDSTVTLWLASPKSLTCLLKQSSSRTVKENIAFLLGANRFIKASLSSAALTRPAKMPDMFWWISLPFLSCLHGVAVYWWSRAVTVWFLLLCLPNTLF